MFFSHVVKEKLREAITNKQDELAQQRFGKRYAELFIKDAYDIDEDIVKAFNSSSIEPEIEDKSPYVTKDTCGVVTQTFNKNGDCLHQRFECGDDVVYRFVNGLPFIPLVDVDEDFYHPYNMVPEEK